MTTQRGDFASALASLLPANSTPVEDNQQGSGKKLASTKSVSSSAPSASREESIGAVKESITAGAAPILTKSKRKRASEVRERSAQKRRRDAAQRRRLRHALKRRNHNDAPLIGGAHERVLLKAATKGVVQLFNAIAKHQREHQKALLAQQDSARRKAMMVGAASSASASASLAATAAAAASRDANVASMSKDGFLEMLRTGVATEATTSKEAVPATPEQTAASSTWSALRDDYMLGAKMRDWGKESSDDEESEMEVEEEMELESD